MDKILQIYAAPQTRFWLNIACKFLFIFFLISYGIFQAYFTLVGFFTKFMMYDYCEYGMNLTELIIGIWVFSVFIDEIRQIWMTPGLRLKRFNQSEHRADKRPPDFQNSSKNYFKSIPSDQGLVRKNPRSLGIWAIFAIFRI